MSSLLVVCDVSQLLKALTFTGGVEIGDGIDGSGDSGLSLSLLSSLVCAMISIVLRIPKGLGGRFRSFRLGGGDDRRPPSKSVGQSRLAGIVVERDKMRLRGCDCGD